MILFLAALLLIFPLAELYQSFRKVMGRYIKARENNNEIFYYPVLLKFFLVYFIITFFLCFFLYLFKEVYRIEFPVNDLQLLFFTLSQIIFAVGIGIYYVSIMLEQFVAAEIKGMKEYKSLRIAIRFFHGPVSHVLIYMGLYFYLLIFSFFEKFDKQGNGYLFVLLVITSAILGVLIGIAQRINMSWKYQLPFFIFYLGILCLLILFGRIDLFNEFTIFDLTLIFFSLFYLIYKYIRSRIKGEKNLYSEDMWRI